MQTIQLCELWIAKHIDMHFHRRHENSLFFEATYTIIFGVLFSVYNDCERITLLRLWAFADIIFKRSLTYHFKFSDDFEIRFWFASYERIVMMVSKWPITNNTFEIHRLKQIGGVMIAKNIFDFTRWTWTLVQINWINSRLTWCALELPRYGCFMIIEPTNPQTIDHKIIMLRKQFILKSLNYKLFEWNNLSWRFFLELSVNGIIVSVDYCSTSF